MRAGGNDAMRAFRYLLMVALLSGLAVTTRNQDRRIMESLNQDPFVVRAVYVDSQGVKWLGTSRGLCRYDDLTRRYYTDADHLPGDRVNAITFEETDSGPGLWVATDGGVSLLLCDDNGVTGSTTYTTDDGLLDNDVADIAVDSRHGKFFGSAGGITWFHEGVMDSLVFLRYYNSMLNAPVRQMDLYNDTLYLAQQGGIGRFISDVDGITGASSWSGGYGITPYSENIRCVMVSGIERQYFGTDVGVETHTGYFAKANWGLLSTGDGLVDDDVISIAGDAGGGLWFGTCGGVSHYVNGTWTSYTTADGLLNDTVYAIGFDLDGSVWFGTGAGACRLSEGTFQDFITVIREVFVPGFPFRVHYTQASGSFHVAYRVDQASRVLARLYNMNGVLVGQWQDLPSVAGEHRVELTPSGHLTGTLPAGIYVMQLISGTGSGTQKLLIQK
ncbi:MAG TPA: T9SS type A sorting domain-containing protein [Bacteroides sp.]|nr:T9SS type A sorting domain-containing protein [Bacteroides sp.]